MKTESSPHRPEKNPKDKGIREVLLAGVFWRILVIEMILLAWSVVYKMTSEDDSLRAVACALAMQQTLANLNREMVADGLPSLEMGIGINTSQPPVYRLHVTYMDQQDRALLSRWIRAA